jgi:dUTP pyrophosphatase
MKVKIKKLHPDAVIPKYAKEGDAGLDLVAVSKEMDENGNVVYGTGLAFEIPKGYVGLLFPRSSNANNDLLLSNSVGVIDSGYRGEVTMKFKSTVVEIYGHVVLGRKSWDYMKGRQYEIGDRVGQLIIMPYPEIEFEEVGELSESERGTGGYGSTGK